MPYLFAKTRALRFLTVSLAGSVVLLWCALLNHYPLVYSDTSSYVFFKDFSYHAAGYAFFIKLTSLHLSLWLTVFVQSLLTAFLLIRLACIILGDTALIEYGALAILVGTVVLADVSKFVSLVMPDITSSWLFLGTALFYLSSQWHDRSLAVTGVAAGLLCHYGNTLTLLSLLPVIYLTSCFSRGPHIMSVKKTNSFFTTVFMVLLSISALNYSVGEHFVLFPSQKGKFVFTKFASYGLLSGALNEYCPNNKNSIFCLKKRELQLIDGTHVGYILWNNNSTMRRLDLFKYPKEINDLIWIMFKNNFGWIVRHSFSDAFKLLGSFDSTSGVQIENTPMAIKAVFPWEYKIFQYDLQMQNKARLRVIPLSNKVYGILVWGQVIVLLLLASGGYDKRLTFLCWALLMFIFFQDFIAASVSAVSDRYNMRVMWLVSYTFLLTISLFIKKSFWPY